MALRAVMIEITRHVIGVSSAFKILLMAGETRGISICVSIGMTRLAIPPDVSSCQREAGDAVIPIGRLPRTGRMTAGAIIRESRSRVIRIGRVVIERIMARIAVVRSACKSLAVTVNALKCYVGAGEWKTRLVVIE